jgi:hypothetical protein
MPSTYFDNFPYIGYTLNLAGTQEELQWVVDIFRRSSPITELLKNTSAYYEYVVIEGETPEIIAAREYGSAKYFWVVALINNILDPILDWPKDYANFVAYIKEKYGSVAAASGVTSHFTMTEVKSDSLGNSSTITFVIDQTRYNALSTATPVVTTFASGVTVTTTITRSAVDAYTYELELNEAKRRIRLLEATYIQQIVTELEGLLS